MSHPGEAGEGHPLHCLGYAPGRPARDVERQLVQTERGRPDRSRARAWPAFQPGSTTNGAAIVAATSATVVPATDPQAKLMAPWPLKASHSVTPVLTTKLRQVTSMNRRCAKVLVSSASGTQARPSMTTHRLSTRTISVACGEPSRRATWGAATNRPAYISVLEATASVNTVPANLRTSPSQRTIAKLTPSSLALCSTARMTWDTAYSPNASGPKTVRASTTLVAKLATRRTTVFSMLQRAPDRTLRPRSAFSPPSASPGGLGTCSDGGRGSGTSVSTG